MFADMMGDDPLEVLQCDLNRLNNSIFHLRRSNEEIAEALKAGHDRDLKCALEENIVTIAKLKAKAGCLEEQIDELRKMIPTDEGARRSLADLESLLAAPVGAAAEGTARAAAPRATTAERASGSGAEGDDAEETASRASEGRFAKQAEGAGAVSSAASGALAGKAASGPTAPGGADVGASSEGAWM